MIRRPPRSTRVRSSAASDVYKRQGVLALVIAEQVVGYQIWAFLAPALTKKAVSYTHLRAHETPEHLVCRLLLEKKKKNYTNKKKKKKKVIYKKKKTKKKK